MYPELKKKNIDTLKKAWDHYNNFGSKENKVICKYLNNNDFDWEHYVDLYKDLKNNGYDTKDKAWDHWIYTGKNEGRIIASLKDKKNFDWESYINYYTDLKLSNINTYDKSFSLYKGHFSCFISTRDVFLFNSFKKLFQYVLLLLSDSSLLFGKLKVVFISIESAIVV